MNNGRRDRTIRRYGDRTMRSLATLRAILPSCRPGDPRTGLSGMLLAAFLLVGCSQSDTPAAAAKAPAAPAARSELFEPVAGIQDLMAHMIDPAADFLWE